MGLGAGVYVLPLLLLIISSLCSLAMATQRQVLYVKPSPEDRCPVTSFSGRCRTLMNYITEYSYPLDDSDNRWFLMSISDITFRFLPGSHVLDVNGTVALSGNRSTFAGYEMQFYKPPLDTQAREVRLKTTIYCTNNSGIYFVDSTALIVANLSFVGCGGHYISTGLGFVSVTNLTILGLVVSNSTGYGALITNAFGNSQIAHSRFVNNIGNHGLYGGNLYIGLLLEESECPSVSEDEAVAFTIEYSDFLDSEEGITLSLRHSCIELYMKMKFLLISGNENNVLVDIEELENERAGHHITVHGCQILNGNAINYQGNPGFDLRTDVSSTVCSTSQQHKSVNSLRLSDTTISGNRARAFNSAGGFFLMQRTCQSYLIEMNNVQFSNNTVVTDSGNHGLVGNIFLYSQTLPSVHAPKHSTVIKHSTIRSGIGSTGGLQIAVSSQNYVEQIPTFEIYNTSFIDNKGDVVGGVGILPLATNFDEGFPVLVHFKKCFFSQNLGVFAAALQVMGITPTSGVAQIFNSEPIYIKVLVSECVFHGNALLPLDKFKVFSEFEENVTTVFSIIWTEFLNQALKTIDSPSAAVVARGSVSLTFYNTEFFENVCVSLTLESSYESPTVYFTGDVLIKDNHATRGGAISLASNNYVFINPNTNVYFIGNTAEEYGGAIYISTAMDSRKGSYIECNLYPLIPPDMPLEEAGIQVIFINNTAGIAGDALYGGYIDFCSYSINLLYVVAYTDSLIWQYPPSFVYNLTLKYSTEYSLSVVSSDLIGACFCKDGLPDCSNKVMAIEAFPGESKNISAVAVGQRNGVVPTTVYMVFEDGDQFPHFLGSLQEAQPTNRTCKNLTLTVYSNQTEEKIKFTVVNLYFSEQVLDGMFTVPVLAVSLLNCPIGFSLTGNRPHCDCVPRLTEKEIKCDINGQSILRPLGYWIGYDTNGVLVHPHCPFAYCHKKEMYIQLVQADDQCDLRHSGILCGGCRDGLSLALGTSQCLKCSNTYLGLILVFAAAAWSCAGCFLDLLQPHHL